MIRDLASASRLFVISLAVRKRTSREIRASLKQKRPFCSFTVKAGMIDK